MPAYSDEEPPRQRRSRRPEYYEPESDTTEDLDYPPPKPRARNPRPSRRQEQSTPAPTAPRSSILVDPDETASQKAKRRPRSNSNVRLRTPSSDSNSADEGTRHRSSKAPRSSRKSRLDLEEKDGPQYKQFRAKRDGYESEEGDMLRHAKRSTRSRDPEYDDALRPDDAYDRKPKPDRRRRERDPRGDPRSDSRSDRELPLRGKPRAPAHDAFDGAATGAAAAAAGAALASNPRLQKRRVYKDDAKARDPYDDYDERPRRENSRREDPRRSAPRSPAYDGYRSEAPPARRRERPRDDYYNDDHDRRREDAGYRSGGAARDSRPRPQDYYSDHRDDRAQRSSPRNRRPRGPDRESYREDDRYRDYDRTRRGDDYDRPAKASKRGGLAALGGLNFKDSAWQKEAAALFMTHAMPVIQKEGTRYAKKELAKFLERQQGGGRR